MTYHSLRGQDKVGHVWAHIPMIQISEVIHTIKMGYNRDLGGSKTASKVHKSLLLLSN
jgi:hypothetical protein